MGSFWVAVWLKTQDRVPFLSCCFGLVEYKTKDLSWVPLNDCCSVEYLGIWWVADQPRPSRFLLAQPTTSTPQWVNFIPYTISSELPP